MIGITEETGPEDNTLLEGRVLVVDDEPTNRLTLKLILQKAGCKVVDASSGVQALSLLRTNQLDLVLVDVVMPEMNGFDVCRAIKGNWQTRHIPVFMVTSLQNIQDLEKGFNLGASDYVTKPYRARELLARVRNALTLKKRTDLLHRQNKQLAREIELAGALQKTMLELPSYVSEELLINFECRPSMNISGDVFDKVPLPDGRLFVYLADASGHGVAAALLCSFLKSTVPDIVKGCSPQTPAVICQELNARFMSTIKLPSAYATLFAGIFDKRDNTWTCMNCGHPSPVLVSSSGQSSTPFETGGSLPIGVSNNPGLFAEEDETVITVTPGETLVLYTDGLIEAQHIIEKEEFGIDRLEKVMRDIEMSGLSLKDADRIINTVEEMNYEIDADDCSIVTISMLDASSVVFCSSVEATYDAVLSASYLIEKELLEKNASDESVMKIQLLLLEYCNNTIEHGKLRSDQLLDINVHLHGDRALITIQDPGPRWNYEGHLAEDEEDSMPEESAESGRGIAIIQSIVLDEEYFFLRDQDTNSAIFIVESNL